MFTSIFIKQSRPKSSLIWVNIVCYTVALTTNIIEIVNQTTKADHIYIFILFVM